jgi:hypothetical protein
MVEFSRDGFLRSSVGFENVRVHWSTAGVIILLNEIAQELHEHIIIFARHGFREPPLCFNHGGLNGFDEGMSLFGDPGQFCTFVRDTDGTLQKTTPLQSPNDVSHGIAVCSNLFGNRHLVEGFAVVQHGQYGKLQWSDIELGALLKEQCNVNLVQPANEKPGSVPQAGKITPFWFLFTHNVIRIRRSVAGNLSDKVITQFLWPLQNKNPAGQWLDHQ